jgi:hypothetical protein
LADNVQLSAGTADGIVLATDDVGGVHYQIVKVSFGALDTATAVSGANPLPVVQTGALPAGANAIGKLAANSGVDIGDVDVTSVPADPFGANADAASATGSISAKLRFIAGTGIPVTGNVTVINAGTFAVQAAQSGTWNVRNQDGSGNAITSATRGSERALTVQIVDGSGNQVTSFSGSGTPSAISTNNSTTSVLAGGAAFTGTADEVTQYASVTVAVIASHASATDGLQLQQSSDNSNWDIVDSYTVPATTGKTFGVQVTARYFRVVYTNGATLQTSFRLQTILHTNMPNASSVRPQDARTNENDMHEVIAYQALFNGTTWDRCRGDTTNGLDVDVTRVPTDPFGANADAASSTGSISAKLRFIAATGIPVTALPASTNTLEVVGDVAQDAAVGGNPVLVGGRASSATPTAMSANGDSVYNWLTLNGAQVVAGEIVDDAAFTPGTSRVNVIGLQADETATDSVDEGDAGAPRMTLDRKQIVTMQPHTQGGTSVATGSITATATSIKASAGQVYGYYFYNPNASVAYVQFFNTASGSVTLGTTAPVYSLGIPASSAANVQFACGVAHSTAITIAVTTTRAGSTSPGSSVDYNVWYQ